MKSLIYIYTATTFILIIIIYINMTYNYNQIIVSNDLFFEDTHIDYKRDILNNKWDQWRSPIKYFVESSITSVNVEIAIKEIMNKTCIKFEKIEKSTNQTQELYFQKSDKCLSKIGHWKKNHTQFIELNSNCYKSPYVILHEIGHALGLVHEHARTDRDEYIQINTGNMESNQLFNLKILNDSVYINYSTSYDYAALMHYDQYEFSTFWSYLFGWPVMESKLEREYSWMMGQREKMTFNEYKQINLCYCNWCNWVNNDTGLQIEKDETKQLCKNGGYPNFNNCSRCLCPTGYTGDFCDSIIESDTECGKTKFDVNSSQVPIILNGQMNCYFYLKAEASKKVQLIITYVNAPYSGHICTEKTGYQVKYRKDKGATGLLLCGHHWRHINLKSESNDILIFYRGETGHSFMHFIFHQYD
ncbi:Astacin-like metalloendopeptidase [Strongyloides ratti]|uniref:Metalloendopeptidase n=1 Tax=Strongyloides ratti TaxID=34506 RepID=A0A090KV54_STRRB|nr:Astacin-like metalloendopeptidase [Strongyloides ratti]CEF59715.1 Astacin-like metalloendopeptidase [Strongyloides ratti]